MGFNCLFVCLFIYLFIYLFIFPPGYVALSDSKSCHRPARESFLVFGNFSLYKTLFPGLISVPTSFVSLFKLLYFVLPPFKDNGLPFWVPDVLCQHLEVVLWNLLSVQMFFRWICGGESGLLILFLCHLRPTPLHLSILISDLKYQLIYSGPH